MNSRILCGDAIEMMAILPDQSIDLVACDPPFQKTRNRWDAMIPFEDMWKSIARVAKTDAAIILFASQPFTSKLVMSKIDWFLYDWCWRKSNSTGHLNAKKMPLRQHEDILVFSSGKPIYNPQFFRKEDSKVRRGQLSGFSTGSYGSFKAKAERTIPDDISYPRSILEFNTARHDGESGFHSTQKPTAIMDYLIRTYSNEGDLVLDFACGSGTTGVACRRAGRNFIGIEKDEGFAAIAEKRIAECDGPLFAGAA
jgi:site-specific DNA-methyltransferase (adenine-specific)